MSFWRKLLYYIFGVGMGVLLVMFIFGDRDFQCSYFPNDRVLSDLRKKELEISSQMQQQLNSRNIDSADISLMLLSGKVDFDKSHTAMDDSCKTYWIDHQPKDGKAFSAEWLNCDSTAFLMEVH